MSKDWHPWKETQANQLMQVQLMQAQLMQAQLPWEGGDLPIEASARGAIKTRVKPLRDPAI
ncbi:MAG: hypothetical protein ACI9OF_002385 [Saprospiraceae bacterium]